MEYKIYGDTIIARLDKGDEVIEQLRRLSEAEQIKLASVNGTGATSKFTVGTYHRDKRKYQAYDFIGFYEITSLTGIINSFDGDFFCHLHLSASDSECRGLGGHLDRAVIAVTCELVIRILPGRLDRSPDRQNGTKILDFQK